jgi:hypothetical protein
MPRVGFEPIIPVFEREETVHASDRAAMIGEASHNLPLYKGFTRENCQRTIQSMFFHFTLRLREPNTLNHGTYFAFSQSNYMKYAKFEVLTAVPMKVTAFGM